MSKRPLQHNATSSKRFQAAIDESIDELVCPITQALPLDPVFAEDGKVYERAAIEEWLSKHQRSPVTNLAMGKNVFAATQIKAMIERMVKSGALPQDKVKAWRARIMEQERVEKVRRAADAGDAPAAAQLGIWFNSGSMGLAKDEVKAFGYLKTAAEAGDANGMGNLSDAYLRGAGVEKTLVLALRWAAAAAALGNARGMSVLAEMYGKGAAGLPSDKGEEFRLRVNAEQKGVLNSMGMAKLALMYAEGQGTAIDMAKAETMMRKAIAATSSEQGVELARAWLATHGLPAA